MPFVRLCLIAREVAPMEREQFCRVVPTQARAFVSPPSLSLPCDNALQYVTDCLSSLFALSRLVLPSSVSLTLIASHTPAAQQARVLWQSPSHTKGHPHARHVLLRVQRVLVHAPCRWPHAVEGLGETRRSVRERGRRKGEDKEVRVRLICWSQQEGFARGKEVLL